MGTQQEKETIKGKWPGRRLIDGLFGKRNDRQQQEREEELLTLLQEQQHLAEEWKDRLRCVDSIVQKASDPVAHLIEVLNKLTSQDKHPKLQSTFATMTHDAKQLEELIQQLQTVIPEASADTADSNSPSSPSLPAIEYKRPAMVLAINDEEAESRIKASLNADYEIRTCHNGWQVLAEVYRDGADIIMAEVQMDTMDGPTMCSRLRSNPQASLIPVILLATDDEQRILGLQHGADMCIDKASGVDVITCSVSNLLHSRRQVQLNYEQERRVEQYDVPKLKKKSAKEKLMERVMDTIYKNMKSPELNVEMIAEEVGMSRMHLNRKLKEIVGQTPHDFIRQLRLEQAAYMLTTQDINITEVVYACGFINASSFTTMFKKLYGLTPSEYASLYRKEEGIEQAERR